MTITRAFVDPYGHLPFPARLYLFVYNNLSECPILLLRLEFEGDCKSPKVLVRDYKSRTARLLGVYQKPLNFIKPYTKTRNNILNIRDLIIF
jgi:hypothetical protein